VGWFGFNGGSALAADGNAAMAVVVTHISAAAATLAWMAIEWVKYGKPSVLGAATGAIAGLAAVTPASGYIGPFGGFAIGLISGGTCWFFATSLKNKLGYDDSLDVFGVHGVGGFVGTILVGVFASEIFGGLEGDLAMGSQVGTQLLAAVITCVYTAVATFVLIKFTALFVPIRVDANDELQGLDISLHEESGYNL
jgi:Amt family ammonium transporter